MIKAVIFDWGGVLIDNPEPKLIEYWSQHLNNSPEKVQEARKRYDLEFQRGTITEAEYWKKKCAFLGIPTPQENSLCMDAFRYAYAPRQEMFDLVRQIKASRKTALLSNVEPHGVQYFQEAGYDMFDVTVFSCVEKVIKPESRIYQLTLEKLEVKPREAIFIDDKKEYVEGAKKIGIHGILFESISQVKAALEAYLVQ